MTKECDELLDKIDHAILSTDWSKLESYAKKARRRKFISQAMEHVLLAEADLQRGMSSISLDVSSEKEELEGLTVIDLGKKLVLDVARDAVKKIHASGTDKERKLGYMLEAKLSFIDNDREQAMASLELIPVEEMRDTLAIPSKASLDPMTSIETDTTASLALDGASTIDEPRFGDVLDKLLTIQSLYLRGLCLEARGEAFRALNEYSLIFSSYRDTPFGGIWKTPAFAPFIGMTMYRYGVLCFHLAGNRAGELPEQRCPLRLDALRRQLLHDSGIALRAFLVFIPFDPVNPDRPCGKIRRMIGLKRYIEVLEFQFQKSTFKTCFAPDQYRPDDGLFCPEQVQEDLLLASLLLESLHPTMPADRMEAQSGALTYRQRHCAKRLARLGATSCLVQFYESLFERFASTAQLYGNLMLAYIADGQYARAFSVGSTYYKIGGKDPYLLVTFCQVSLLFGLEKIIKAKAILEKVLSWETEEALDMRDKATELLAKAQLVIARSYLPEQPKEAALLRESAVQLMTGETAVHSPDLLLTLGMAYLELGRLDDAEKAVKQAISLDSARSSAWYLLALLRTAQQDYTGALEVCNVQLDLQAHPDLNICLLKTAILAYFDEGEDAIELTKACFHYWITPPRDGDDAWAPIVDPSSSGTQEINASQMTLNTFQRRFVGKTEITDVPRPATKLTFSAIPMAFPKTPLEAKVDLVHPDISFLFNPAELIAINSLASQNRISDGFKKYGLAKVLWLWLSKLYVAERQYHEAELAAKAAFAIDELDPEVYYRLGRAFEAQGANRLSEAIEAYEKGLDIDPSHPGCNLGLARKHLQMAQREVSDKLTAEIGLAIHHAKATLRARPTDHRAAHLLAQAYHLMGLEREAGDAYQTALSLQEYTPLLFIAPNAFIIATVPFL